MVRWPGDYRWTSYRSFIGRKEKSPVVDAADTLLYFSEERSKAVKAYRKFVEEEGERDENPFKNVEAGVLLGDKRFKAKIRELIDQIKVDGEIPQAKRLRDKVSIDAIIDSLVKSQHHPSTGSG